MSFVQRFYILLFSPFLSKQRVDSLSVYVVFLLTLHRRRSRSLWSGQTPLSRSTTRKCVGVCTHGAWSKWRTLNTATLSHYGTCSLGEEREGEKEREGEEEGEEERESEWERERRESEGGERGGEREGGS